MIRFCFKSLEVSKNKFIEMEKKYFYQGGNQKAVELEDVKFHQCVRLSRFENDRTISFIPPDGEFDLMTYRLNSSVKPLILVETVIERFSHSRVEYIVKAKSQFKRRSTANSVEIIVPVPSDADGAKFKTSTGYCKYLPQKNCVVWNIKSFPGGKEYLMKAHFNLPSIDGEISESKKPIEVKFEIPYYTVSGIQVLRFIKTHFKIEFLNLIIFKG
jgi:AP-1 complex subunit mu